MPCEVSESRCDFVSACPSAAR